MYEKTAAVILIDADAIKMKISNLRDGSFYDIDNLEYPISFGAQIFMQKRVDTQTIEETNDIINGYLKVLKEYSVSKISLISTEFICKAKNLAYIIDQIKINTGLRLKILSDENLAPMLGFESYSILKESNMNVNNSLFLNLNSFTSDLLFIEKNEINSLNKISFGIASLLYLKDDFKSRTLNFNNVICEFISSVALNKINEFNGKELDYLIISRHSTSIIFDILGKDSNYKILDVKPDKLLELAEKISLLTNEEISKNYSIAEDYADILSVSLSICSHIVKKLRPKNIIFLNTSLTKHLTFKTLDSKYRSLYFKYISKNAISCAKYSSKHYLINSKHDDTVLYYCNVIFDKLKKLHGLTSKHRLLLDISAILHYPNKNLNIFGLNSKDLDDISHILYMKINNSFDTSSMHALYLSKLSVIFRIADALDISKDRKIKDVKVKLKNKTFILTLCVEKDLTLEKWVLDSLYDDFEEIFGLKLKINVKSLLLF